MPSWWGKSSSKEVKQKANRESILETIQRKLKNASEGKYNYKSGGSSRHHGHIVSGKGSRSMVSSRATSPSSHVSHCQSFAERPHSQPLPLPGSHLATGSDVNSGSSKTSKLERAKGSEPSLYFPLPKPVNVFNRRGPTDAEGDIATASVSSDSSIDSADSFDSHLVSPLASDCENGNRATVNSSFRVIHKDQSPITIQKNSRSCSKPAPQVCSSKLLSTSPKGGPLHLQITLPVGLCGAPDSSMSSPSRSPMRVFGPEQVLNSGFWTGKPYTDIASGHCSSPGSGHNSVVGDMSGQIFLPQNRYSPECSPIPSPRMTSPGPRSRIQTLCIHEL